MEVEEELVSNPTRALVCAAKYLYFLSSLGNLSAASLLARDGGACAARPGLAAEKGGPPRTPSIYTTVTWSGRVGDAKYKRRDANDNKRGCKLSGLVVIHLTIYSKKESFDKFCGVLLPTLVTYVRNQIIQGRSHSGRSWRGWLK